MFLEVDEHQHQYGYNASISCDLRRMSHVLESLFVELGEALPFVFFLRYNCHAWRVNGNVTHIPKDDREKRIVAWLDAFEATKPLEIGYAFYDEEDGNLEVLSNEHYNPQFAEAVTNLRDLAVGSL